LGRRHGNGKNIRPGRASLACGSNAHCAVVQCPRGALGKGTGVRHVRWEENTQWQNIWPRNSSPVAMAGRQRPRITGEARAVDGNRGVFQQMVGTGTYARKTTSATRRFCPMSPIRRRNRRKLGLWLSEPLCLKEASWTGRARNWAT
jgi:hypothetical protein